MHEHSPADSPADMEPHTCHAIKGKDAIKKIDSPVRIHIHSIRRKLADADGISGKAAIDGIVKSGILIDDSSKEVKSVTHSQEKTDGQEKTIIQIEVLDDEKT